MAFWSQSDKDTKDPKRGFRWVLIAKNVEAYTVKKVSKPSFTLQESTHKYLNHTYYYPGRVEWNTVTLTLVDPVNPDAAATIMHTIREGGYSPALKPGDYGTMSKGKAAAALGNLLEIRQLDSDGQMVESWKLHNPWIKDVKFGELDYDSDDLTMIDIEIRYDWAELETANVGKQQTKKFFNSGQK